MTTVDNETWLLEAVEPALQAESLAAVGDLYRLIYALWVADYGMRNAGDLATAEDLYPDFMTTGASAARALGLQGSYEAFSLERDELEACYFSLFDKVCDEIRRVAV